MLKRYDDSMDTNHPVMDVVALFVVNEKAYSNSQMRELILIDRIKPPISKCASKGEFSNGRAERPRSQSADASSQFKVDILLLLRILFVAGCWSRRAAATSTRDIAPTTR